MPYGCCHGKFRFKGLKVQNRGLPEMPLSPSLGPVTVTLSSKTDLPCVIQMRIPRWGLVLDYSGGPAVMRGVLISGRPYRWSQRKRGEEEEECEGTS